MRNHSTRNPAAAVMTWSKGRLTRLESCIAKSSSAVSDAFDAAGVVHGEALQLAAFLWVIPVVGEIHVPIIGALFHFHDAQVVCEVLQSFDFDVGKLIHEIRQVQVGHACQGDVSVDACVGLACLLCPASASGLRRWHRSRR